MEQLKIEYLPIGEVKPYDKNAKEHPKEQVEQIKESIRQFGMDDPIGIWKGNVVIEGHGRLMACKELGFETVPVIRLDHLTDEERKAYALIHNKTTMNSDWNYNLLEDELRDIENIDMESFGFEWDYAQPDEVKEDDYEVNIPEEPKAKRGQIYQLGDHRLMCGDSTNQRDIDALLDGAEMDMVMTDPPYNVALGVGDTVEVAKARHRRTDGLTVMNDQMSDADFNQFLVDAFSLMDYSLKVGGVFYIWHADSERYNFEDACKATALQIKETLIWVKSRFSLGRQDYQWQHEPCLYGWKEGARHYFIDERNHSTVIEDEIDIENMKKDEMKSLLYKLYENTPTTVIREMMPAKSKLHPTMKPVVMIGKMIQYSSKPGEKVMDTFGGSGTTMIACEQLGRSCYMMELDPKYVDTIIDRWEQFTGLKAVLIQE